MERVQSTVQRPNPEHLTPPTTDAPHRLPGHIVWDQRPNGLYGIYSKDCYEGVIKDGTRTTNYHHTEYLGKVIDKQNGIFSSRKRGIFKFTLENGYEDILNPDIYIINSPHDTNLRFGTTWVFDEYLKQYTLNEILDSLPLDNIERDTLYSLLAFKTFAKELPYRKAETWFSGDYSSILYPKAILYSQSIGLFLKKIGEEYFYRIFFKKYLDFINRIQDKQSEIDTNNTIYPFLIDSTGLINSIEIPITAPCSHGGPATNQIRLIYVVDHISGLPVYFRYVPGNIVDKTTLIPTINTLKSYNIDIKMLIMDAGYYSKDNIEEMLSQEIPFILRMPENNTIFADILNNNSDNLKKVNNIVKYHQRILYIIKIKMQISGNDCYAYLCLDPTKEAKDIHHFINQNIENEDFKTKYAKKEKYFGKFLILSNKDIPTEKIIETYYARAKIEQIFDIAKNMTGLLPLKIQSEETLRGHLLISFISSVIYSVIFNKLSKHKLFYTDFLYDLSELRIDIYANNKYIIHELSKNQRQVIEALDLEYPFQVKVGNLRKAQALLDRKSKGRRGRPKGSKNKPKFVQFTDSESPTALSSKDTTLKRKPGRPPGSKNLVKAASDPSPIEMTLKKKPGRPLGSKNKPKATTPAQPYIDMETKRKPGRPPGSKNKVKVKTSGSSSIA